MGPLTPRLLLLVLAATPALQQVLGSVAADSLVVPLERYETLQRGGDAAEAALLLGQLRYARGEYRQAAVAFARAGGHADPVRREEARYWAGMAWLGAGDFGQARSTLAEAAQGRGPRRPDALLGVALCWEAQGHPDRAMDAVQSLLAGDGGAAAPAALERMEALAVRLGRPELARRARERLLRDYPRSMEAMRAAAGPAGAVVTPQGSRPLPLAPAPGAASLRRQPPPVAVQGPLMVQIGVFREGGSARALAERARRAGFLPVRVSTREGAGGAAYVVRVGLYATAEDARSAGQRLGRALGVPWRVVPAP
jgi:tetratricopeptide (TPR) repeat protein